MDNMIKNTKFNVRKQQIDELNYAITNFETIAINGSFGSGKSYLKDEWKKYIVKNLFV